MFLRNTFRKPAATAHRPYAQDEIRRLIAAVDAAQESISRYTIGNHAN